MRACAPPKAPDTAGSDSHRVFLLFVLCEVLTAPLRNGVVLCACGCVILLALGCCDRYDPIDAAIPLILSGGVTTSQILPGSGNAMGGEGFIVKMRGRTVRDAYYPGSPRLLKHALGENPKVRAAQGPIVHTTFLACVCAVSC